MLSFFLSNTNVKFAKFELKWRRYTITKALPIKKRVELINCQKFAIAALDLEEEAFVVHVALLEVQNIVHPFYRVQITLLIANKILVKVPREYIVCVNVFFKEVTIELPEYIGIHNHFIDLEKDKQLSYGPIYRWKLVELDIFKIYIKENLKNGFNRP